MLTLKLRNVMRSVIRAIGLGVKTVYACMISPKCIGESNNQFDILFDTVENLNYKTAFLNNIY